jgi:hypothetical protein
MEHQQFLLKVKGLVIKAATQGFVPVQLAAGNGLLIVQDSEGEFDTYFDKEKWEFAHPKIWKDEIVHIGEEIGVLPGNGRYPAVASFEGAVQFASEQLRSKDPACTFYPQLQTVN